MFLLIYLKIYGILTLNYLFLIQSLVISYNELFEDCILRKKMNISRNILVKFELICYNIEVRILLTNAE